MDPEAGNDKLDDSNSGPYHSEMEFADGVEDSTHFLLPGASGHLWDGTVSTVRERKRGKRGHWDLDQLREAVGKINAGDMTFREAERYYGIPARTIKRRIETGTFDRENRLEKNSNRCQMNGSPGAEESAAEPQAVFRDTYFCGACEFRTRDVCNMREHSLCHSADKPYKCALCQYTCVRADLLRAHVTTHTGLKPYRCTECDYAASYSSHLKQHMLRHTGERPHRCEVCGYTCNRPSNLRAHMRTHVGLRPYKCGECDYEASQAGHLARHLRVHTGERPYSCDRCEFKSVSRDVLNRHVMYKHGGQRRFGCTHCDYRGVEKRELVRHLKVRHGVTDTEEVREVASVS